jgi:flagellar assembly protein FliH/type III secretion protein L
MISRARVIKGDATPDADATTPGDATTNVDVGTGVRARRVAAEILAAREEAAKIVAEACARAAADATSVATAAATEAREQEVARLAASFLALRADEAQRAEREADRLVELAVILAERLVGEAIRVEPARIVTLAAAAIDEARGAGSVRIDACPEDVPALREALGDVARITKIEADISLGRGSLVVHTDIGRIDARLETQLAALSKAVREALR